MSKCHDCGVKLPLLPKRFFWAVENGKKVGRICESCYKKRIEKDASTTRCYDCGQELPIVPVDPETGRYLKPVPMAFENGKPVGRICSSCRVKRLQKELSQVSWRDALILEENEDVVCFWGGIYEAQMTVVEQTWLGKHPATVKQRDKGVLVLTSRKLVWIEERGTFGRSYHPLLVIPLENLRGISMGGAFLKYVSISDVQGEYLFHLGGVRNEIELSSFKEIVFDQITARKQELETEKKKERVHVLLDFSFLKSYMEKGGLTMQTYKCPECGASMKLPETGNEIKCDHCGNMVYAQDIFEKVKLLVG